VIEQKTRTSNNQIADSSPVELRGLSRLEKEASEKSLGDILLPPDNRDAPDRGYRTLSVVTESSLKKLQWYSL